MSRTWTRAFGDLRCGGCGRVLRRGAPVLLIGFSGPYASVKRKQERCVLCAGEPAPADLPPVEDKTTIQPSILVPTGPGALPFDWKTRAGEREPGADD